MKIKYNALKNIINCFIGILKQRERQVIHMIIVVILNAIALICGFARNLNLAYIVFGITWTAFFYVYEKITWKLYERILCNRSEAFMMNVRISHIAELIIIMAGIYVLMCKLLGKVSISISIAQIMILQSIKTFKTCTKKNILILVGIAIEFVISVSL